MERNDFLRLLSLKLTSELSEKENERFAEALRSNAQYRQLASEFYKYFGESGKQELNAEAKLVHVREMISVAGLHGVSGSRYNFDPPAARQFRKSFMLKVAAIFIAVAGAVLLLYYAYSSSDHTLRFVSFPAGENKVFKTLDDGTKVWLNKGAVLKYNEAFGKKHREMFLEGEGFFDVARNAEVPLTVHAGKLDIGVKGTAFNVKPDRNAKITSVSLFRGVIEVRSSTGRHLNILLKPNEQLIVQSGSRDSNTFIKRKIQVQSAVMKNELKWTRDSIVFKKEKLKDLAAQLELKYDVKIEIRNEKLKDKKFSGVFRDELVTEALDALKLSYHFTYTITDKVVIIK